MNEYLNHYPPILDVGDVAEILNITPKTARKLILNGSIPSLRVGRLIRVPKNRFENYLEGES